MEVENSKSGAGSSWTATNTYYRPPFTHTHLIFSSLTTIFTFTFLKIQISTATNTYYRPPFTHTHLIFSSLPTIFTFTFL